MTIKKLSCSISTTQNISSYEDPFPNINKLDKEEYEVRVVVHEAITINIGAKFCWYVFWFKWVGVVDLLYC